MTTTAIMCIARNESPFVEEWAQYHLELGFDRLYYISTDEDFSRAQRSISQSPFRSSIEVLHFDDFQPGWQIRCYNAHLPLIAEDWVLVIDLDEFLYLHPFSTIHEYLETIGEDVGQIQFPWLLHMSSRYSQDRVLGIVDESAGYVSDHVKSMIRRECTSWVGIHAHDVGRLKNCLSSGVEVPASSRHTALLSDPAFFDEHPFVLHFASRGHLDVMNRMMDHQFFNAKSSHAERPRLARFLLEPANWSSIPTRCLILQFYRSLPRTDIHLPVPALEARTDVRDLQEIFLAHVQTLVDFDCSDLAEVEERFERQYRYAMKLAALDRLVLRDPTRVLPMEEYLECGTQEDYIDRLRKSLVESFHP